ncbi:MAG TPA: hypothetical protein VF534_33300 [Paraburkholderia sp.]
MILHEHPPQNVSVSSRINGEDFRKENTGRLLDRINRQAARPPSPCAG